MADFRIAGSHPSPPDQTRPNRRTSLASLYQQTQNMSSSPSQRSQGGSSMSPAQDQGPLESMNLGMLKTLTEKKTTRDGQPAKRRGPKPDSKPALTRRQELNRQAQRTHRERKELYIKALEDEVLRLKEVYSNVSQGKDKLAEENRRLKALLQQSGIATGSTDDMMSDPGLDCTSSGSAIGSSSYAPGSATAFTPPTSSAAPSVSTTSQLPGQPGQHQQHQQQALHHHALNLSAPIQGQRESRIDYDQAGIDFVLTLEKPCMDHMPWLLNRAHEPEGEPCGHALMASCPPERFADLSHDTPFGPSHSQARQPHEGSGGDSTSRSETPKPAAAQTWELSKADLATLLDLSKKLDLDGEITPVMAWGMILGHPRLAELEMQDFQRLVEELQGKVRCYGFGAVMEDFEVRDALNGVFLTKTDVPMSYY